MSKTFGGVGGWGGGGALAWTLLISSDFCPRISDVQGSAMAGCKTKGSADSRPAPFSLCEWEFVDKEISQH